MQGHSEMQGLAGRGLMTRRQLVKFLNKNGYPITISTLNKLSMPSRGVGPEPEGRWGRGRKHLYDSGKALRWAQARFRSLARDR
jgi:hypothetical protein